MIKAIILDQEETIYNHKKIGKKLSENTQEFICESFKINKEQYGKFYSTRKTKYPNFLSLLIDNKISINKYQKKVFDKNLPSKYLKKDLKLIQILSSLNVPLFIVTLSPLNYSNEVQKKLGINGFIRETYSLSQKKPKKEYFYKKIAKKLKLEPYEICIVGDNFEVDLKEAKKMGFNIIEINKKSKMPFMINSIYELPKSIEMINYPPVRFVDWEEVEKLTKKIASMTRKFANAH